MWINIDENGNQNSVSTKGEGSLRNLAPPVADNIEVVPRWTFYEDEIPVTAMDDNVVPLVKRNSYDSHGVRDYMQSWYYRTLSTMPIAETHTISVERAFRADLLAHDFMDSTFFAHTLMAYNGMMNLQDIKADGIANIPNLTALIPSNLVALKEETYPAPKDEDTYIIDNPCGNSVDILSII